jgi:integrase/recombinase XerC
MLISVFYSTGMRLSELIKLKEKQVDFSKSNLRFWAKEIKKGSYQRRGITDNNKDYINEKRKIFEKTDDVLLVNSKGRKLYPKYVYNKVKSILNEEVKTLDKKAHMCCDIHLLHI